MKIRMVSARSAFPAVLFLALAGCAAFPGGPLAQRDDAPQSTTKISSTTLVRITAEGAGPLNAETRYSTKAIREAMPGYDTRPIQTANEDHTLWTTGVFKDGFQVFQVMKGANGRIGQVHGVTHDLEGPNGERMGMTFARVGTSLADCRAGRNLWRDMAVCKARGAANVSLVYAVPGYDGPLDQLPPPDELKKAEIQRIIWTPHG